MPRYVALLRAVNVGGTGKLAMADLRALCEAAGWRGARTYIASGNVVFDADGAEAEVAATLAEALLRHMGKPVGVIVRTGPELAAVLAANPFAHAAANRVVAIFLNAPPAADALAGVTGLNGEQLALGAREIFVRYGDGMAQSRLNIPAAKAGTARNLNTVARLAEWANG